MKIYTGLTNKVNKDLTTCKDRQKSEKQGNFSKILDDVSKEVKNKEQINKGIELNNVFINNISSEQSQIRKQAVEVGEQVLDLLSDCSLLLSEPHLNHSRLQSIGDALKGQVDNIKVLRERLDKTDPLRQEIERIGILGVVESIKIERGDYS